MNFIFNSLTKLPYKINLYYLGWIAAIWEQY